MVALAEKKTWLALVAMATAATTGLLLLHGSHAASQTQARKVSACSLLTMEEVKQFAPWPPQLDQFKPQEDVMANGSGCSYPSVYIQVMSMPESGWKRWLDGLKDETLEPVSGIGDEAFIRDNKKRFAELCAKVGGQVITVQYDLDENQGETTQSAKPRVIALAKALAAKL
jgi:hypothetical protein